MIRDGASLQGASVGGADPGKVLLRCLVDIDGADRQLLTSGEFPIEELGNVFEGMK